MTENQEKMADTEPTMALCQGCPSPGVCSTEGCQAAKVESKQDPWWLTEVEPELREMAIALAGPLAHEMCISDECPRVATPYGTYTVVPNSKYAVVPVWTLWRGVAFLALNHFTARHVGTLDELESLFPLPTQESRMTAYDRWKDERGLLE